MLKHNRYFEDQVQSIGFERHGQKMTVGVIDRGAFHFATGAAERVTVVSGALEIRIDGANDWRFFPAGTSFEVAGQSGFDVRAEAPSAYLCEFL
jgi:uncharacterized protein YaiE (UPF0345 family)